LIASLRDDRWLPRGEGQMTDPLHLRIQD